MAFEMNCNHSIPFVFAHVKEHPLPENPSNTHYTIYRSPVFHCSGDNLFPSFHFGNITSYRYGFNSECPDLFRGRFCDFTCWFRPIKGYTIISNHDIRTFLRSSNRYGFTNSGSSPCNDYIFSFQKAFHYFSFFLYILSSTIAIPNEPPWHIVTKPNSLSWRSSS